MIDVSTCDRCTQVLIFSGYTSWRNDSPPHPQLHPTASGHPTPLLSWVQGGWVMVIPSRVNDADAHNAGVVTRPEDTIFFNVPNGCFHTFFESPCEKHIPGGSKAYMVMKEAPRPSPRISIIMQVHPQVTKCLWTRIPTNFNVHQFTSLQACYITHTKEECNMSSCSN
jgi:hypothetical protein